MRAFGRRLFPFPDRLTHRNTNAPVPRRLVPIIPQQSNRPVSGPRTWRGRESPVQRAGAFCPIESIPFTRIHKKHFFSSQPLTTFRPAQPQVRVLQISPMPAFPLQPRRPDRKNKSNKPTTKPVPAPQPTENKSVPLPLSPARAPQTNPTRTHRFSPSAGAILSSDIPARGCQDFAGPAGTASVFHIAKRYRRRRRRWYIAKRYRRHRCHCYNSMWPES
jgi:hypothetical protein